MGLYTKDFLCGEMMTNWIPIFKTGEHTDSQGNTKTWTEAELDAIITKYRPGEHEAPAVIGHPKDNGPAWGWVEALKRDGHILYAKFKDLAPEFVDMVKKGLFKKRSISLYPDMTLRHVGFLGAMPPAVKGLPDVAFRDGGGQIIEFNFDCNNCRDARPCVCTNMNEIFRKEAKGMKWFDWLKGKAKAEGVVLDDAPVDYTAQNTPVQSVDINKLVDVEVMLRLKEKEAEFAEELKKEVEKVRDREAVIAKKEADIKKATIASFCEGLLKGNYSAKIF